jgi:hypothetical protein
MGDPQGGHAPKPTGAKASPVRLVVLLAVLALMVGALGYDQLVAGPGSVSADKTLKLEAEKNNAEGFSAQLTAEEKQQRVATSLFNPQKVQEILKRKPDAVVTQAERNYAVEYYRYWGPVPLFNRRHYLAVVYHGKAPNLRYTTHYVNTAPPAESLPGYQRPAEDSPLPSEALSISSGLSYQKGEDGTVKTSGNDISGGGGGGKGKGKGKGKGGGLPPPGESPADTTPPAEAIPTTQATPVESTPPAENKDGAKTPAKDDAAKEGAKPAEAKPAEEKAEAKPAEKDADEKPAAKDSASGETKEE